MLKILIVSPDIHNFIKFAHCTPVRRCVSLFGEEGAKLVNHVNTTE